MKCNEISQLMPDLATDSNAVTPEINNHLQNCAACSGQLAEFRQLMGVLDEWQVPEPSPYFDTRLMARVREEKAKPTGWLYWLRKPALAVSLAVLMVMSATLIRTDGPKGHSDAAVAGIEPGTAVSDLQALDKHSELYSDFEILDDLQVQSDVTANP